MWTNRFSKSRSKIKMSRLRVKMMCSRSQRRRDGTNVPVRLLSIHPRALLTLRTVAELLVDDDGEPLSEFDDDIGKILHFLSQYCSLHF